MASLRPIISIVIFNKNDHSIQKITDSLLTLSKLLVAKLELVLVVYDKNLSRENEQHLLKLRKIMNVRFIDYTPKHPETDLKYYARGKKIIVRRADYVVTEKEMNELVEKELKK